MTESWIRTAQIVVCYLVTFVTWLNDTMRVAISSFEDWDRGNEHRYRDSRGGGNGVVIQSVRQIWRGVCVLPPVPPQVTALDFMTATSSGEVGLPVDSGTVTGFATGDGRRPPRLRRLGDRVAVKRATNARRADWQG